jgi:hypothetical protein
MSRRTWGWIVAVVVLAVVCAGFAIVWHERQDSERAVEAHRKAVELKAKATALGIRTPPVSVLEAIYGDDGGALVATADSDLARALLVSGIGRQGEVNGRPVVVDRQVLIWHYLVLSVYQPKKAAAFKEYLRELSTSNVVPN